MERNEATRRYAVAAIGAALALFAAPQLASAQSSVQVQPQVEAQVVSAQVVRAQVVKPQLVKAQIVKAQRVSAFKISILRVR